MVYCHTNTGPRLVAFTQARLLEEAPSLLASTRFEGGFMVRCNGFNPLSEQASQTEDLDASGHHSHPSAALA
jgi:hypothetical protein